MSTIGVDIGSSQVKAVAFEADGRQIAVSYAKYTFVVPRPGWMELDGREVLPACLKVIKQCAADAASAGSPVLALAISSQGEAFSPVDAHGNILAPAMISGDCRSADVIAQFTKEFGLERIYRITGHTPSAMFSIAKLLYLAKFMPEIRQKAAKFLCFEDLLIYALSGEAVMGWPEAGRTMLFDVVNHCWSKEILDAIGYRESEFAHTAPCGSIVGTVTPQMTAELGLPDGVKLVAGGHDQIIGAFGCGATKPGTAMYAAGSVECFVPIMEKAVFSHELCEGNLCTYDFATPDTYASVAYSLTGSNLLEYFMKTLAPDRNGDYTALLAEMPAAPTDILALPYFTPSGTPYFDERTPGTLFNWRLGTSRGELLKGLEEGIAMEMKLNFNLLERSGIAMKQLIATGGGFRNPAMVQLRADALNLPISLIDVPEAGCRGAASLACKALTGKAFPNPDIKAEITPNPENAEKYADKFAKYVEFSRVIRTSFGKFLPQN